MNETKFYLGTQQHEQKQMIAQSWRLERYHLDCCSSNVSKGKQTKIEQTTEYLVVFKSTNGWATVLKLEME